MFHDRRNHARTLGGVPKMNLPQPKQIIIQITATFNPLTGQGGVELKCSEAISAYAMLDILMTGAQQVTRQAAQQASMIVGSRREETLQPEVSPDAPNEIGDETDSPE